MADYGGTEKTCQSRFKLIPKFKQEKFPVYATPPLVVAHGNLNEYEYHTLNVKPIEKYDDENMYNT
jgi:hypothetical protein